MILVDDLKWAVDVMLHPSKKATQTWTIGNALVAYWKTAIIPMILTLILVVGAGGVFATALTSMLGPIGTLTGGLLSGLIIGGILVEYLIFVPIGLLIGAGFIHIAGKVLGIFKGGGYAATFSAMVYGVLPWLVLSWIPFISVIGELWSIVVTVFALSNIQKTTKLMAFVAWIGGIIIAGIIAAIIGAVVGVAVVGLLGGLGGVPAIHH
ncbi:MAG: hypothetical protein ACHQX1_01990 [Candidatus Micrarchaeales archaeon]